MSKALEICKNLKRTIDTMTDTTVAGESSIRGNSPWGACKPSKNKLKNRLLTLMKKNNITDEQIR